MSLLAEGFHAPRAISRRRGLLALAASAAWMALGGAAAAQLVEGKNFARLRMALPVETGKKIGGIEFFSYGCPHCAELEPHITARLSRLPPDGQVRRVA